MVTCTDFIQPLNLKCLLVNTLSGNTLIFIGLAFIFIAAMAARFKMPNEITLIMFLIFATFIAGALGGIAQGIFVLTILIATALMIYIIAKLVKN